MHSALVRIQNVFGFFTTVASCVAGLIALTVLITPQTPTSGVTLRNVQIAKGRPHYYSTKREEYAHVKFDLDLDLSSLFTWNTKQVFVWITAKYPSTKPNEPPNEAVIWDAILPSEQAPWHQNQYIHPGPDPSLAGKSAASRRRSSSSSTNREYSSVVRPGMLRLRNQRPKYQITDHTGLLAGRENATLELNWNVQPWVGALLWSRPFDLGVWKKTQGAVSEVFRFPDLKSAGAAKPTDMGTVKGGEGNRGKPA